MSNDKLKSIMAHFDAAIESARLYGSTDANKGFGVYTDQNSRFVRCMHESIAKHRRALESAIREAIAAPGVAQPQWIVNDLGELGVQVGQRFYFLYKGDNIEYGEAGEKIALHDDGTPMKYRMVGKREFGEVCHPMKWLAQGRSHDRYTEELVYTPGLSFGKPEDGAWRDLPSPTAEQERPPYCGSGHCSCIECPYGSIKGGTEE